MASTDTHIPVFAYGSSILRARLRTQCPGATSLGVAALRGYGLAWHKRSQGGSGKCDVIAGTKGSTVSEVVYELPRPQKARLNRAEGLEADYDVRTVTVTLDDAPTDAVTYKATDIAPTRRPYTWYRALVVVDVQEHGLSPDCVDRLRATRAIEDPDRDRHLRNVAQANGGGSA